MCCFPYLQDTWSLLLNMTKHSKSFLHPYFASSHVEIYYILQMWYKRESRKTLKKKKKNNCHTTSFLKNMYFPRVKFPQLLVSRKKRMKTNMRFVSMLIQFSEEKMCLLIWRTMTLTFKYAYEKELGNFWSL